MRINVAGKVKTCTENCTLYARIVGNITKKQDLIATITY